MRLDILEDTKIYEFNYLIWMLVLVSFGWMSFEVRNRGITLWMSIDLFAYEYCIIGKLRAFGNFAKRKGNIVRIGGTCSTFKVC